jgi:hypothetical protein
MKREDIVGVIMKLITLVIIAIIGGLFVGSAILLVWMCLNLVAGIGSFFPNLAERNHQTFISYAIGAAISVVYFLGKNSVKEDRVGEWFDRTKRSGLG